MTKEEKDKEKETSNTANTQAEDNLSSKSEGQEEVSSEKSNGEVDEKDALKAEIAELKDKFLRLYSDFENYKKRTAKERIELIRTANEDVLSALLPVVDDFERAIKSIDESKNAAAIKEGVLLINQKLTKTMESKGVKPMDSIGKEFNPELMEAITQIPAADDMKGKVVDEVEKGFYLNEKVIRFAKVVIGS